MPPVAGQRAGLSVDRSVATFADLSTLPDKVDQENIYATDASGDATVDAGWAIYKYILSTDTFVKIAEQESLDQSAGVASVDYDEPYTFLFFSDLDTVSAELTLKGPRSFLNPEFSPKLTGISYEAKLSSNVSYTQLADLTALNNWISTNVTTANTYFDIRLIADFGANTGAASATIYETKTLN